MFVPDIWNLPELIPEKVLITQSCNFTHIQNFLRRQLRMPKTYADEVCAIYDDFRRWNQLDVFEASILQTIFNDKIFIMYINELSHKTDNTNVVYEKLKIEFENKIHECL